nr:hypothetical protein [Eubacterium sp.]
MMKGKLIASFWKKEIYLGVMVFLLFLVAGIATEHTLLDVMENYHKWEPIRELEGEWYFYKDDIDADDKVEKFLIQRGAMDVLEYRRNKCSLEDPTDIGYEEHYDDGVLWQASADDVKIVQVFYPEAEDFQRTTDVIAHEDLRNDTGWVVANVVTRVLLWGIAIAGGIFWFRRAVRRSQEEICYLAYVGNEKKVLRKLYCNSLFVLVPCIWVWVLSSVAIVIPGESGNSSWLYAGYRQMYIWIPIAMFFLIYIMTWILYMCCRRILMEHPTVKLAYVDRGIQRIYISDYSVEDNLELVLMSQGFSHSLATTLVDLAMQENGIEFCAKRSMDMCPREEKLVFFDLQEEFMRKEPVEI